MRGLGRLIDGNRRPESPPRIRQSASSRASATSRSWTARWGASPRSRPGFSYISILTGVTALFGFGYRIAGPGVWWTWPVVVVGQMLVALCFMELAGQYPIAGSVYQWSKQLSAGFTSWMTGWIYIVGAIVTIAAVAVDWQVVLPQITTQASSSSAAPPTPALPAPRAARRTRCCSARS